MPEDVDIEKLLGGHRRAFDRLFEQRILFMKGPLEDESADLLVAQMLALDADGDDDITLYVNSPGGIITGMFAVYDTMTMLRSKVDTRCVGLAASAAAFLLAVGTGTRSATANSRIMIHQPLGGARGTAKDIEQVRQDTDRDYWMTAEEAVDYGLIDEVVRPGTGSDA